MKFLHRGLVWLLAAVGVVLASLIFLAAQSTPVRGAPPPLDKFVYLPAIQVAAVYDWPQFNFDARHSGNNTLEAQITISNVNTLTRTFQQPLPAVADGAPVYLSAVNTMLGMRDLIIVTTRPGGIVAMDAHTGSQIWANLSHGPGGCLINNNSSLNETCYTTSSPAVDPNRQFVYGYGMDGKVHKYAAGDGVETLSGGWPQTATLKVYDEKGSSALSIATAQSGTSYLYVANGGYPGDSGNYQGHISAINLTTGAQQVFNAICSNQTVHFVDSRITSGPDCLPEVQTAIWARPGVVYSPETDKIYMATGNGTFNPGSFFWGDTVFSLNPDGTGSGGKPLDTYTPVNFQHLQNTDTDIGSTAPALLPPSGGNFAHLAVQSGKDGVLRLINLDNLSGHGGTGFTGGEVFSMSVPMGGGVLTQPAVWTNPADGSTWIFVANGSGITGLKLVISGGGNPSLQMIWTKSGGQFSGTSPIVANGVLFHAHGGLIAARNPVDGNLLWSSNQIGGIHWESPIVANGMLYVTDGNGKLNAFALP